LNSFSAESSTPVIRKASGLSSLIQSNKSLRFIWNFYVLISDFSGSDSDDDNEEEDSQSTVDTTVITKPSLKQDNDKSSE